MIQGISILHFNECICILLSVELFFMRGSKHKKPKLPNHNYLHIKMYIPTNIFIMYIKMFMVDNR